MKAILFPILLLLTGAFAIGLRCEAAQRQKQQAPGPKAVRPATAAASAAAPTPGKLIFGDDFSNPSSGWERERDRDFIADYVGGEYQIKNAVDHQVTDGMFQGREISDGDFSITARKVSGPDDIRLGLIARHSNEESLEAWIVPDGRCSLWMRHFGQQGAGTRPDLKPCPAVHRGNEANQLRLVVSGAQATFYVNGEKVAEASNIGRSGRHFGFLASSTSAGSEVRFDNFKLHAMP